MQKKAFTLIELLVVIVILAFIISVVSPAGYRLYSSFLEYIAKKEASESLKEAKFNAFITQSENKEYNISILGAEYNYATPSRHNY